MSFLDPEQISAMLSCFKEAADDVIRHPVSNDVPQGNVLLIGFGLCKVPPSYHPVEGSEVSLLGVTPFSRNDRDLNQESPSFHRSLDKEVRTVDQDRHDHEQGGKYALGTNQ